MYTYIHKKNYSFDVKKKISVWVGCFEIAFFFFVLFVFKTRAKEKRIKGKRSVFDVHTEEARTYCSLTEQNSNIQTVQGYSEQGVVVIFYLLLFLAKGSDSIY